jgi:hypothetical protein
MIPTDDQEDTGDVFGQSRSLNDTASFVSARHGEPDVDEDAEILREAQERFRQINSSESQWRRNCQDELNFLAGEHWASDVVNGERKGLPCLTFDRIGPSIDQVENDTKQSPPSPKFSPVGAGADKDAADDLQGLLRNIENDSGGMVPYMTAYGMALRIGRGWWRWVKEYEDDARNENDFSPTTFQMKLKLKRIPNPFSVYPDTACQEFDYSDMRYCFATEDIPPDVYKELYPDSIVAAMGGDFEGVGDRIKLDWFVDNCIRIAEYWKVITTERTVYLLPGGKIVEEGEVYDATPIAHRKVQTRTVKGYKINGSEILERWDWEGKFIPFVPVIGKEYVINERVVPRGMIRAAMDANKMFDYLSSKIIQIVGTAPVSNWLIAEESLGGYEQTYTDANRKPYAILKYRAWDEQGRAIPPPQRISLGIDVQPLVEALKVFDDNTKAALSVFDASLGAPGPEQSGKAIIARQREGDNAHFDYRDNLGRSLRHSAAIFLDLAPHIYSEERWLTIVDPDGSVRNVLANPGQAAAEQMKQRADQTQKDKSGIERILNLGAGKIGRFDVTISAQQNFATRQKEGVDAMLELTRTIPQAMVRGLDILVRMMDFPHADELAERLVPPDIAAQDQSGLDPQTQAKVSQMTAMIQQLGQLLQAANDETMRLRLKLASDERRGVINALGSIATAEVKAGNEQQIQLVEEYFADRVRRLEDAKETANPPEDAQSSPGQQPGPGAPPSASPAGPTPTPASAGQPGAAPTTAPAASPQPQQVQ